MEGSDGRSRSVFASDRAGRRVRRIVRRQAVCVRPELRYGRCHMCAALDRIYRRADRVVATGRRLHSLRRLRRWLPVRIFSQGMRSTYLRASVANGYGGQCDIVSRRPKWRPLRRIERRITLCHERVNRCNTLDRINRRRHRWIARCSGQGAVCRIGRRHALCVSNDVPLTRHELLGDLERTHGGADHNVAGGCVQRGLHRFQRRHPPRLEHSRLRIPTVQPQLVELCSALAHFHRRR